jgi:AhpD family alkylhydroperoxidase
MSCPHLPPEIHFYHVRCPLRDRASIIIIIAFICNFCRPRGLICLRASQINGCAYCIDMRWKDLRAAGETEQLRGWLAFRASSEYLPKRLSSIRETTPIARHQLLRNRGTSAP